MASDVSFACDHTKLVKSYCHPTSAKNLTEEDIINYKCDNRTRTMLCRFLATAMQCFMGVARGHQTPLDIVIS